MIGLRPIWCFEENGLVGYGGGVYVREKENNCFSVYFCKWRERKKCSGP
jgi:hypothetical protein